MSSLSIEHVFSPFCLFARIALIRAPADSRYLNLCSIVAIERVYVLRLLSVSHRALSGELSFLSDFI